LQLAKPALHDDTTQLLAEQAATPFAAKQAIPQPPQFSGSFVVVVSQPLAPLPSQSALPAAQLDTVH
jgi:hypothetical protein